MVHELTEFLNCFNILFLMPCVVWIVIQVSYYYYEMYDVNEKEVK